MPADDWYVLARERCHALAREMVRLDTLIAEYERREELVRADQLQWDRDELRHERSRLMREIWRRRSIRVPTT